MYPRPSDRQLARDIGITAQHLGSINRGESGTKRAVVERIAIALSADVNEAYERAGFAAWKVTERSIQFARRLDYILRKVPEDRRETIETLLERDAEKYADLVSPVS